MNFMNLSHDLYELTFSVACLIISIQIDRERRMKELLAVAIDIDATNK